MNLVKNFSPSASSVWLFVIAAIVVIGFLTVMVLRKPRTEYTLIAKTIWSVACALPLACGLGLVLIMPNVNADGVYKSDINDILKNQLHASNITDISSIDPDELNASQHWSVQRLQQGDRTYLACNVELGDAQTSTHGFLGSSGTATRSVTVKCVPSPMGASEIELKPVH